jgi:hypothetical protein
MQQFKIFCKVIFFSTVLACSYGIFTYLIKINPYIDILNLLYSPKYDFSTVFLLEKRGILEGRICGTNVHPLGWGQMLALLLSFSYLSKSYMEKVLNASLKKKCLLILLGGIVVVLLINIFLSGSRSAYSSIFVFYFFLFLSFKLKKKIKTISVFGIALLSLGFIIYFQYPTYRDSITSNVDIEGSSVSMRQRQLSTTFDILNEGYQLFGLGKGLVELDNNDNNTISIHNYNINHKINALLGFESILFVKLIEQGICGLWFFLLFYFQSYFFIRQKCKKYLNSDVYIVDGFFLSYLFAIFVTGIQATFYMFFLFSIIYLKYIYIRKAILLK